MAAERRPGRLDIMIFSLAVVLALVLLALGASWVGELEPPDDDPIDETDDTEPPAAVVTFLNTTSGNASFNCEVADTDEERAMGLMDRESLEQDAGMLFAWNYSVTVSFWMKNTLIPLDMIFIDSTGRVVKVAEADPEPDVPDALLTRYPSEVPVRWVLEINQGISGTTGIVPGTQVIIAYD